MSRPVDTLRRWVSKGLIRKKLHGLSTVYVPPKEYLLRNNNTIKYEKSIDLEKGILSFSIDERISSLSVAKLGNSSTYLAGVHSNYDTFLKVYRLSPYGEEEVFSVELEEGLSKAPPQFLNDGVAVAYEDEIRLYKYNGGSEKVVETQGEPLKFFIDKDEVYIWYRKNFELKGKNVAKLEGKEAIILDNAIFYIDEDDKLIYRGKGEKRKIRENVESISGLIGRNAYVSVADGEIVELYRVNSNGDVKPLLAIPAETSSEISMGELGDTLVMAYPTVYGIELLYYREPKNTRVYKVPIKGSDRKKHVVNVKKPPELIIGKDRAYVIFSHHKPWKRERMLLENHIYYAVIGKGYVGEAKELPVQHTDKGPFNAISGPWLLDIDNTPYLLLMKPNHQLIFYRIQ